MRGASTLKIKKRIKKLIKKRYVIIVVIVLLIALFLLIGVSHKLTVTYYEVETDKLESPVRIALLTDLHNTYYGKKQARLISKLDEQSPDIVVMTGDMVDEYTHNDAAEELLIGLQGKYKSFYISGNHEVWTGELFEIKKMFSDYGVHVLDGQCEVVEVNGQSISILGVDDPEVGGAIYKRQLNSAFDSLDEDLYTVFLFHRPELFEELSDDYAFDLMLAGHAHGGQLRLPYVLNGIYAPEQGFLPRYAYGRYEHNDSEMIVSTGLSLTLPPPIVPRVFNPPEIVIIDIVPAK